MDDNRKLLRHLLATLAYRTRKALDRAPDGFGAFHAGSGVRTPAELVQHMTRVLRYARSCFTGEQHGTDALSSLADEVVQLNGVLGDLARHLGNGAPLLNGVTLEQLLQGPFSDAMTHAGQLAMLRRLAGSPVAPEHFDAAPISAKQQFGDR